MISNWEYELNKKLVVSKGGYMNLSGILNSISKKNKKFALNSDFPTIRYIEESEYKDEVFKYVEPSFRESDIMSNAKFILISAPGATGKSALAKHVSFTYNGIYWELPNNKVAEYSFQGAIMEAVGSNKVSDFIESLKNSENFLVIDAFDEAEAGSGRTGIEFFLRDLNNVTTGTDNVCAILLARTESAIFIKNYFNKNNISFNHYEVGYFAEYNAKTYIKNGLEKLRVPITNVVNECIDAQFKEIKRILMNKDTDSFLGYAPVLNALSTSYDNERNTLNLLKNTCNSENNCCLLKKILDDLLIREREKFIKALKVKIPKILDYEPKVYDKNEQLLRILGKVAYNDEGFLVQIDESIPIEYHEEYLEVVNTQLPQHPFIKLVNTHGENIYDFTGAAFSDYVVAYNLSLTETSDFVRDYISNKKYYPSPLLIEFYDIFSNKILSGSDIPLMYNSFKAHSQFGDMPTIYINGDNDDCSVEFVLIRDNRNELSIEFSIPDLRNGIYIDQLSNCYIDVDGDVYVGSTNNEARICNSVINCNKIIWRSEQISIEAYSPSECVLVTDSMSYSTDKLPTFEVKTDDRKNFKVCCPSLNGYFKLIPYHNNEVNNENKNDFVTFSNLIRRIFSCLRSHSKDAPARKVDFINNRIISTSEYKRKILTFLIDSDILYTDEQDWLYKLKTDKISEYSIKWHNVRDGDFESLKSLYDFYNKKDLF